MMMQLTYAETKDITGAIKSYYKYDKYLSRALLRIGERVYVFWEIDGDGAGQIANCARYFIS